MDYLYGEGKKKGDENEVTFGKKKPLSHILVAIHIFNFCLIHTASFLFLIHTAHTSYLLFHLHIIQSFI